MSLSFKRSERVRELLRQEISLFVQQINDPRLGFVTITGVRLSDDLTDAKVFYSVYGPQESRESTAEILNECVGELRHDLGRKLESLRKVPMIRFVFDDTPEKAQRVEGILQQLAHEHAPASAPVAPKQRAARSTRSARKKPG